MTDAMKQAQDQLVAAFVPFVMGQIVEMSVRCTVMRDKLPDALREELFKELLLLANTLRAEPAS